MNTEQIEETDINGQEEAILFRDQVFEPDELIPMLLELMTCDKRLYICQERKPKPEKDLFKKRGGLQVRYQQALAILDAYGLLAGLDPKHPIRSLVEGYFIENGPEIDNDAMEKELRECLKELDTEKILAPRQLDRPFSKYDHQDFFKGLFYYLIGLRNAAEHLEGYLIMNTGTSRASRVIGQLQHKYSFPQMEILHRTLMLYIRRDTVKPYTIGELIDNYGYRQLTEEEQLDMWL